VSAEPAGVGEVADWLWLHANAAVVGEAGIVIRGASGAGKSALTLALIALAQERKMFAALIGDDRVAIAARSGRIVARGAPRVRGLIERRGYGIVAAPAEPTAVVRLVVDLLPERGGARLPEDAELSADLSGVALPRLTFGAESGAIARAYAILARLDKIDDKNMTEDAHFA
jgi:serine kinase of HPr protein (carbohydrate metabolism regulator)